jgi:hypothetical protein
MGYQACSGNTAKSAESAPYTSLGRRPRLVLDNHLPVFRLLRLLRLASSGSLQLRLSHRRRNDLIGHTQPAQALGQPQQLRVLHLRLMLPQPSRRATPEYRRSSVRPLPARTRSDSPRPHLVQEPKAAVSLSQSHLPSLDLPERLHLAFRRSFGHSHIPSETRVPCPLLLVVQFGVHESSSL